MARSTSDSSLVVAMFRESTNFDPSATDVEGYAVSHDGGNSWAPRILLSTAELDKGLWRFATEPVAAFDAAGNHRFVRLIVKQRLP